MNIIHLSDTPSASQALNKALLKHTQHTSECIPIPQKISGDAWDSLLSKVQQADIVHVHGCFDLENTSWASRLRGQAPEVKWVQQYYTIPEKRTLTSSCPGIPQLAFLNHTERYLPYARVVPSVVLESEIEPVALSETVEMLKLAVIKRGNRSAWDVPVRGTRWACEGFKETMAMAEHLAWKLNHQDRPTELSHVNEFPREACLDACRGADLIIDSFVTGSFYPSSLEFLALGIPSFIHLDNRCFDNLLELTGAEELPWVFTRVEEADTMISELVHDSELRVVLGENARDWVERFYGEKAMVQHYVQAYEDLLDDHASWATPRFDLSNPKTFWDLQESHDTIYEARKRASGLGREILSEAHRERDFEQTSQFYHYSRGPAQSWLYQNRFARMDGLEPLFDVTRRQCLLERYAFVSDAVEGMRVLDLGSGTGYGSALLKSEGGAASVQGVDRDFLAVSHANDQYADKGVSFSQACVESLDLDEGSFDVITAFGIVEYVKGDGTFLKQCHALLKPGGVLFISSPDTWHEQLTSRHRRSHSRITFENFVKRVFPNAEFFIQEPAFKCSEPAVFEPQTIRPCIPEDYLDPGQVIIAKCLK